MRINNIGYLIKEGLKGIFLRGFMSFAAVCVTVACLLIVGTFSVAMFNVDKLVTDLNKTNEIRVFIDFELKEADAKSIGTKINTMDNIEKATYVPRERALEEFQADYPAGIFGGVYAEDLYYRFQVMLTDNSRMEQTMEALKQIPGVVAVEGAQEEAAFFSKLQQVLEVVSVVAIAVLLVISLLIISNTVKLVMYDRRDEISIMKMVGATNSFIRIPFVIEGMILGLLGAVIAFGLQWAIYRSATDLVLGAMASFPMIEFTRLILPIGVSFIVVALLVGIGGSVMTIRRYLKV